MTIETVSTAGIVAGQAQSRSLTWAHGNVTVQRLGGMLGPVQFLLPDGREVMPLHTAPWVDTPEADQYSGIMHGLRGEWPCVPFGVEGHIDGLSPDWAGLQDRPTGLPAGTPAHGVGSHSLWDWADGPDGAIAMIVAYPADHPIERLDRIVRPDPVAAALDLTLTVTPRRDCRLPIGLHPTLRLPTDIGMADLLPGKYRQLRTFPGTLDAGAKLFRPDAVFQTLSAAPLEQGGTVDVSHLPIKGAFEELIQIVGADGTFAVHNRAEGYVASVNWNPDHFPSLNLWLSHYGRTYSPWSSRHLALGIEPICAAFDLGTAISAGHNPIAASGTKTAHDFKAGEPFTTQYRISVSEG